MLTLALLTALPMRFKSGLQLTKLKLAVQSSLIVSIIDKLLDFCQCSDKSLLNYIESSTASIGSSWVGDIATQRNAARRIPPVLLRKNRWLTKTKIFQPPRTMGRARLPTTVVWDATFRVTTAPIPNTAPRPMTNGAPGLPCRRIAPVPM